MPSLPSRPFRRPAWWTRPESYNPRLGEIQKVRFARVEETDYARPLAAPLESRATETDEARDMTPA